MSYSVQPHRWQPTWDSPGKNTGVGCHFLLQCMEVKSESEVTQSCPTLSNPKDCSPPGSSGGVYLSAMSPDQAISGQPHPGKQSCRCLICAKLLQSCPNLCDPRYHSPPGSSVHGILQARIVKWAAIPSSRGSSQPRDQTHIFYVSYIGTWVLYY